MQHTELLHNILEKAGTIQHMGRLKSVLNAVESVMSGANLDLTSLGRHMNKEIKPKSKIKEIDYLLSNGHLHKVSEESPLCDRVIHQNMRKNQPPLT